MIIIKNKLQTCMDNQLLNDCLVTFVEREFLQCSDDDVIDRFLSMKSCRMHLFN